MKPKPLLLGLAFTAFYLFTDLVWQIGRYLTGNTIYVAMRQGRGWINLGGSLLAYTGIALLGYYCFYHFFYRRRKKTTAVLVYLLAAIPLMTVWRYFVEEVIIYLLSGRHNYGAHMRQPARYFIDNIYFSIYYSAFGLVFFFIQLAIYQQKRQNELQLQSRNAELAFLRSQVNPHFLFNSLNNVYTLVYQGSSNALPSIARLSELLRYMLYEGADTVPLARELGYLRNFIDLQLMRYNFQPATNIRIEEPADGFLIVPLLVIPFVENAFKHGELDDPANPLTIDIRVENDRLNVLVINKKNRSGKDEGGGIGLENSKRRLELVYGTTHTLNVSDEETTFTVRCSIPLTREANA